MKRLYNIAILLYTLLSFSCQKQEVADFDVEQQERVLISMDIYNSSAETRATAYSTQTGILGDAEYIINTLRIVVFASDGSLEVNTVETGLSADHIITKEIEVLKDSGKELYFIANEPAAVTEELGAVTSATELEELHFAMVYEMCKGFNAVASFSQEEFLVPMCATYSVPNASTDIAIIVGLKRSVARVDLYLSKGSGAASREVKLDASTTLSATGVTENYVMLFEGEIESRSTSDLAGVKSSELTLSTSSSERVLSFYVAERTYDVDSTPITITIDGLVDGTDVLNPLSVILGEGITNSSGASTTFSQIERNHIYRINGTYNGVEIVAKDFEIMAWEDFEIDAEIEGVMVAVDSEVAMDWLRNGNTYASNSISFGSNKPIEFYLPVSTSSSSDPTPTYEFQLFDFGDMSAGKSYNLKEIALTNHYIYATNWIESAMIYFTSDRSGYIEFVYTPKKVNYAIQQYPIRIKSDNVTKQMKAVYDNGYLSATSLSADWAERAPGGVVFAKRGEANHPLTTPEILDRDEDGYYRGEYKITADEATRYCEERFGPDWYMPSYADMKEVASMFDMLGVSYRFQNNGSDEDSGELTESRYWTSSASSQYAGMYWTADFMSRESIMDDLMERREGTDSYFVRCVMDLQ